jgi:UDP-2-acetamido-3-amino-2,3-dideoxy-glucuronate N-acetyltransferase
MSPPGGGVPRIAVVGCGYWGKNLVRNFAELGALFALVDARPEVTEPLVATHGCRAATLDDVLGDQSVEGVAIATPAASHYTLAKRVLEASKHVFVEKPLALDLADAERLCKVAVRCGRQLMVGHLLQYHPAFLKLKEIARAGGLGRLQYIYSNRLNFGLIRREEDSLWSFAPHDISMILGLVEAEPDGVDAVGAYYLHPKIADVTTTHLSFPGGERAHVFVSWLHPCKEQRLVVVGDRGMAVFDDGEPWDRKLVVYPHKTAWINGLPQAFKADGQPVPLAATEPLKAECQHFLDCIVNGATPRTDGREGVRVLRVLACASAALARGRQSFTAPAGPARGRFPGVMIHESAYVDESVEIGPGSKIWHFSHILPQTRIGTDVVIGQNVVIGPNVTVGNKCKIQNNVSVYKGVTLEDGVFCGPSCVFTNVINPRAEIQRKNELLPTLVRCGATIGANATIVCGVTIGEYAFIAAGAVVAKDVPAFALMAGVPARRIGWMSRTGERLGPDLVCPGTGRRYRQVGPDSIEEVVDDLRDWA